MKSLRAGGGEAADNAGKLWTRARAGPPNGGLPVHKCEDSGENANNLARVLRPDAFADRLASVSLDDLAAQGVRGIIVDLDNTLVGYGLDECADLDAAWVREAVARGFRVVLLSNNFTNRVRRIGEQFGVPTVSSALKPLPTGFLRALRILATSRSETVVVGDQLFTDVLGSRLAGLRVILTHPLVAHDWLGTRLLRRLERVVLGPRRPSG